MVAGSVGTWKASGVAGSDDLVVMELYDLVIAVAQPGEHLIGMLAL
jgi:hypothetical protein